MVYFNKEVVERREPPRDNSRNPNRARRGPPTDREDDEAEKTKREMAKRFREAFRKATAEEKVDSDTCTPACHSSGEIIWQSNRQVSGFNL